MFQVRQIVRALQLADFTVNSLGITAVADDRDVTDPAPYLQAFGLGDIERFPFINMPAAKSIRAGYALLEELGALAPASPADPAASSDTALLDLLPFLEAIFRADVPDTRAVVRAYDGCEDVGSAFRERMKEYFPEEADAIDRYIELVNEASRPAGEFSGPV